MPDEKARGTAASQERFLDKYANFAAAYVLHPSNFRQTGKIICLPLYMTPLLPERINENTPQ